MEFKDIIKELRIKNRLDREEAANLLGVAKQTLGHYENGRSEPPFKVLKKMSEIYGVTIGELFGDEIPKPVEKETSPELLKEVIELLAKQDLLDKNKTFDELNTTSKEIITSVINKVIADIEK